MTFAKPEATRFCEPLNRDVGISRCDRCYSPNCYHSAWREGVCEICGKEIDPIHLEEGADICGHWFCSSACAEKAGFDRCEHCWEWYPENDLHYDECGDPICDGCIERKGYIFCDMAGCYGPKSSCILYCEDRHGCDVWREVCEEIHRGDWKLTNRKGDWL